jgi:hypothetical protein
MKVNPVRQYRGASIGPHAHEGDRGHYAISQNSVSLHSQDVSLVTMTYGMIMSYPVGVSLNSLCMLIYLVI